MSHQTGKLEILKKGHILQVSKRANETQEIDNLHRFKQKKHWKGNQSKPRKNKKEGKSKELT